MPNLANQNGHERHLSFEKNLFYDRWVVIIRAISLTLIKNMLKFWTRVSRVFASFKVGCTHVRERGTNSIFANKPVPETVLVLSALLAAITTELILNRKIAD